MTFVTLQAKTSLACIWWYFEKYHFEIFIYKNPTSAWHCACVLSIKILNYVSISFYYN